MARSERRSTGKRDYESEGLTIHWDPEACIHSGLCVIGLPEVFDPDSRPWVHLGRDTIDAIVAVVDTCPSRALTYTRTDGGAVGPGSVDAPEGSEGAAPVVAMVRNWGPLVVMGELTVLDSEGEELSRGDRHFFCRCGGSGNKPFCDGTHKRNGFDG